jgi:hypothetical protein
MVSSESCPFLCVLRASLEMKCMDTAERSSGGARGGRNAAEGAPGVTEDLDLLS